MIRRLFSGKINSITTAALLVGFTSLISRFLGLFRDRILAGEFGAGDTLDIYYAAFRIPDLIFNLLVLGALSAGFIPIFTGLLKNPWTKIKDRVVFSEHKTAWILANNILNIMGLSLILLSAIGVISAPVIVKLITPGFSGDKLVLTIALTRVMFLSPVILGISSIFGGILQSFKSFFAYSLAPIMYNIGIIIGALYLVPIWGIYGLAWGVVLGALMHALIQLPAVIILGFRYLPVFNWRDSHLRSIIKIMVPRTMSLAIVQINLVVITIIASTLESGSLSIFNFANNMQSFPIGIFGISFAVAAFPALSALAKKREQLIASFSTTIRQILFFIVPATILLITLRAQIIRVILGTGRFDWQDTSMTIDTLGFFALSLFAQATIPLLVRMFYARHDSHSPFLIGLGAAVINIILSLWLAPKMGVAGLALAFSLANIANFIMLWLILNRELKGLDEMRILYSTFKFSLAAIIAGIIIQGMKLFIWPYVDMDKLWGVLTQGLFAGLFGLIAYFGVCSLLKSEELNNLWQGIKKRLAFKKIETGDQGEARGI